MQSILDRYFAVNPQQINPLNLPYNRFVPTASPAADARFLRDVATYCWISLSDRERIGP